MYTERREQLLRGTGPVVYAERREQLLRYYAASLRAFAGKQSLFNGPRRAIEPRTARRGDGGVGSAAQSGAECGGANKTITAIHG